MTRTQEARKSIESLVRSTLEPLALELVLLETDNRQNRLIVTIDHMGSNKSISIEDCVRATRQLNSVLDTTAEMDDLFSGSYHLEVSSPGIERPLVQKQDYEKFSGKNAKLRVFRPLTGDELGNTEYFEKNPKQKNFIGVIQGIQDEDVLIQVDGANLKIPFALIAKANLEANFETFGTKERKIS